MFDLACAAAHPFSAVHPAFGRVLIAFLIAILPANIYAAMRRIDFGGHGAGPVYLVVRVPLQILLIAWAWWFCVRLV